MSLICEGVFVKFPKLKVVLIESGVTWLPAFLWRLSKFWRGVRNEVPWIDRSPHEIVRDHVRRTIQPLDAPAVGEMSPALDHLDSDEDTALLLGLSPLAVRRKRNNSAWNSVIRFGVGFASTTACDYPRLRGRELIQGGLAMNMELPSRSRPAREARGHRRLRHPSPGREPRALRRYLSQLVGLPQHLRHEPSLGLPGGGPRIRRAAPNAARRDAWPPGGGAPATDVDFHAQAVPRRLQHRVRGDAPR